MSSTWGSNTWVGMKRRAQGATKGEGWRSGAIHGWRVYPVLDCDKDKRWLSVKKNGLRTRVGITFLRDYGFASVHTINIINSMSSTHQEEMFTSTSESVRGKGVT